MSQKKKVVCRQSADKHGEKWRNDVAKWRRIFIEILKKLLTLAFEYTPPASRQQKFLLPKWYTFGTAPAQKIFVLLVAELDIRNFGDKILVRGDEDENPRSIRLARLQSGDNPSTKIFSDKIQVAQRYR